MTSMNDRIDVLKMAHDNIDSTIKSVDLTLEKYNRPQMFEKRIEKGIANDLEGFLGVVKQNDETITFFSKHSNYKGADKLKDKCLSLRQKSVQILEAEFSNILQTVSAKAPANDPFRYRKEDLERDDFDLTYDLIPSEKIDQLSTIAQKLEFYSKIDYRRTYIQYRSKCITTALNVLIPEKKDKALQVPTNLNAIKQLKKKDDDMILSQKYYKKGSHPFIFYMNFYLKLLESERKIALKVVSVDYQKNQIYGDVVSPSLKIFKEQAEDLADKNRTSEKVFVMLDILENFENKLLKNFEEVLAHTQHLQAFKTLSETFKNNINDLLTDFHKNIHTNQIKAFEDGVVHQATSNAFSFMKRLLEYPSIENILKQKRFDTDRMFGYSDIKTYFAKYLLQLIEAVEHNIDEKKKQYSTKQKSLASLFVLNNHYYIFKNLQDAKIKKHVPEAKQREYKKLKEDDTNSYIRATWDDVLSHFRDQEKLKPDKNGKYPKKEIKKRFSKFNELFQAIYMIQRTYCIRDIELKEELRDKTREEVIPVYTQFVEKYKNTEFSKNVTKYVSYDSKTLGSMIDQFFDEERNLDEEEEMTNFDD
ncbi:exocyst complex component 7 [Naegleria gruberi]|uniref:Exocyst subunit Exo70 family protein n=1 Tax=Naegleria gruberi TaxID=5762 RepID=D2UX81_NAEGR|nr:exocyst complex component 7 [Naegleria gruberi]EFC50882.1 exocyst complex component 7 [Naegleria gruberi]|eukprot:XP_002683626.1 exocyst complex component 7 [Naegleria gruberi strain NEG-M]